MQFSIPFDELVLRRRSFRTYLPDRIPDGLVRRYSDFLDSNCTGPFGSSARFKLLTALGESREELKGLGTYGFISGRSGFLAGAVQNGEKSLEDYGYLMELAVLLATDLGLGTCWLGGTFSKSNFQKKMRLSKNEEMPTVAAIGMVDESSADADKVARRAKSRMRLPPDELFFDGVFGAALKIRETGEFGPALEMVRWAPSASNKQPWRVVRIGTDWHFFLARTKGYGKGTLLFRVLGLSDLQRVDLGIAMCHFELMLREQGAGGAWVIDDPGIEMPSANTEYVATWKPALSGQGEK